PADSSPCRAADGFEHRPPFTEYHLLVAFALDDDYLMYGDVPPALHALFLPFFGIHHQAVRQFRMEPEEALLAGNLRGKLALRHVGYFIWSIKPWRFRHEGGKECPYILHP